MVVEGLSGTPKSAFPMVSKPPAASLPLCRGRPSVVV